MKKIITICDKCKKEIKDMEYYSKGEEDYHTICFRGVIIKEISKPIKYTDALKSHTPTIAREDK